MDSQEKTPEMNELEPGLKSLKIWAHNFEKQKSYSLLKLSSEKLRGRIGWLFAGFGKRFNPKKYGNSLIVSGIASSVLSKL